MLLQDYLLPDFERNQIHFFKMRPGFSTLLALVLLTLFASTSAEYVFNGKEWVWKDPEAERTPPTEGSGATSDDEPTTAKGITSTKPRENDDDEDNSDGSGAGSEVKASSTTTTTTTTKDQDDNNNDYYDEKTEKVVTSTPAPSSPSLKVTKQPIGRHGEQITEEPNLDTATTSTPTPSSTGVKFILHGIEFMRVLFSWLI